METIQTTLQKMVYLPSILLTKLTGMQEQT